MTAADAAIAELASRQHGAFSAAQAASVGMSRRQAQHRLATGRWVVVLRGVHAIAGSPSTWHQRAVAPLLLRPDAVLAGLAAGHALGLVRAPLDHPVLIVPPGSSARALGASRAHRSALADDDVTLVDGLRTTAPARTLVDLATVLPQRRLVVAVDDALHRRLLVPSALDGALERVRPRRTELAERVLAAVEPWRGIRPGSPAEVRLLRQLAAWGVEPPARQVPILDPTGETIGRADLGWPAWRYGLEYDGDEHHGPTRWAHDERRHAQIVAAGWRLDHVGARDLLPSSDLRHRILRALPLAA